MKTAFLSFPFIIAFQMICVCPLRVQAGELHESVKAGNISNVVSLISKGTNVNEKAIEDGSTPLHWAAHKDYVDIAQCLISNGANINAQNQCGDTPLHWAAGHSCSNMVAFLLTNNALINATNDIGVTPLHYACEYHADESVIRLLINRGANINASDKRGKHPIDFEDRDAIKSLMLQFDVIQSGDIHKAVLSNDLNKVKHLIQKDPGIVNEKNSGFSGMKRRIFDDILDDNIILIERKPLNIAAAKGFTDIADFLLMNGADIHAAENGEKPPLVSAIEGGHIETIQLLIDKGALDKNEWASLHRAVELQRTNIIELLIHSGADVNCRDLKYRTPLHIAVTIERQDIVELLIKNGAKINVRDTGGSTPLHYAAYNGSKEMVELLIKNGAQVDPKDTMGVTPLMLAILNSKKEVLEFVDETPVIHGQGMTYLAPHHSDVIVMLIKNGAKINGCDRQGWTPLHDAALSGRKDIVELLINKGADINALTDRLYTPLEFAQVDEVKLIIQKHGGISGEDKRQKLAREKLELDIKLRTMQAEERKAAAAEEALENQDQIIENQNQILENLDQVQADQESQSGTIDQIQADQESQLETIEQLKNDKDSQLEFLRQIINKQKQRLNR